MTFSPVILPALLLVAAAVVIMLRLITMRQLATGGAQRWATVWRWSGLTLAVVLLLIAAARPAIGDAEQQAGASRSDDAAPNVFLVVDRSADTGVTDYDDGRTRLAGIRDDVTAVIDRYPNARIAMITFASRPSLEWPLSKDSWSLKPVVAGLSPVTADAGEVNAAAAANILRYQLIAAGQRQPGAPNLVFYFGSGAPGSSAPQGEFDPVPNSVDGGAVLGYGTARNEAGLQRLADQLGVPYIARDGARPVTEVIPDLDTLAPEVAAGPTRTPDRTELYWVFALASAVLLLFEIYLTVREIRARRGARRDVVL
ncbi:vWA domain-containing protein [Mycobacterium sp. IDR2000157661]|uniref:vWA domain-containing protein n=1 Tax=Mycobacterium sp. IDR2000157661 TaxID=2867005 RepID=UPI001EEC1654|nr:VWA domain-containing protein [Mycobacterium sp. IDR2000157661]ULE34172.1 VWA domain-containing protein [Mycobacterium sp. IDR2000157661]